MMIMILSIWNDTNLKVYQDLVLNDVVHCLLEMIQIQKCIMVQIL